MLVDRLHQGLKAHDIGGRIQRAGEDEPADRVGALHAVPHVLDQVNRLLDLRSERSWRLKLQGVCRVGYSRHRPPMRSIRFVGNGLAAKGLHQGLRGGVPVGR